ncbi:hypothetical protein [uncultured Cellulomonas sp.]|uniref:hypothetical protein n=1 Tax=uncultured Cellulomonas sp. TaxID=189682 RepID=UPI0028EDC790|nr:hypothetical protein [uncultured Cellulomonas sp.]
MAAPRRAVPAALAWVTHPVTCVALLVLVVNDHVLKAALGTWWTGKLSDAAWLVVAPALLAALLAGASRLVGTTRASARSCAAVSLAAVGAGFVLTKTSSVGAQAASAVLSAVAGPSVVLADPTDLLALPALVLAWAVARAASSTPGRDRRPALAWAVMLPVVVLATAATSQMPPTGASRIAVVDGRLLVSSLDDGSWYVSDDGSRWQLVPSYDDDAEQLSRRFDRAGGTVENVCAPSGDECFRVAAEGLGVDRSDDGGSTWSTDWAVPDDVLPALAARYQPEGRPLHTVGVALLPTADGFRVYAANDGDGLAVRDEDGTWTRLGFTYRSPDERVVPLPGEPTRLTHPLPAGVPLAVPAALVALGLVALGPPRGTTGATRTAGRLLAALAVVVSALVLWADAAWAVVAGQQVGADVTLGPLVAPALLWALTALGAAAVTVATALLRGRRTVAYVVLVGIGVALAVGLVRPSVLAAVTAVAVLAAGAAAARTTSDQTDETRAAPPAY